MKTGIKLIKKERQEQITKHGRTIEIDFFNNADGQLWKAARAILDPDHNEWPEDWGKGVWQHIMNKPGVDRLVIAGALIAAEIDRLNYKP